MGDILKEETRYFYYLSEEFNIERVLGYSRLVNGKDTKEMWWCPSVGEQCWVGSHIFATREEAVKNGLRKLYEFADNMGVKI